MLYIDFMLNIETDRIGFADKDITLEVLKERHGFEVDDIFRLDTDNGRVIFIKETMKIA